MWAANNEIQDIQNIMTRNLEKVIERGFKIEVIVEKADI